MIPYGRQHITDADIDAVLEVLRSDFLTQGPAVGVFERAVASEVGASRAIAVNSATSALHIACLALGLGPGDLLWTVPNTFVASANCGRYCGAAVGFVDIDAATWNISVTDLADRLARAKRGGRLPKILVPVHFAGQPTEQEAIWNLADEYGVHVLEDASHAIGASRNGERVGSCRWSAITVFSFHPVKIITTAEGGMAVTNDDELAERMVMLRSHGITRDPARMREKNAAPWRYEQQMLGFNYRLTDVQAALGTSQLTRLHHYVSRRNDLARRYDAALKDLPLTLPVVQPGNVSAFHLYPVRLQHATPEIHRSVFEDLRRRDVGVNLHYTPVHLQPYYREQGFTVGQFPQAESFADSAITLPLFPELTLEQHDQVIGALDQSLAKIGA